MDNDNVLIFDPPILVSNLCEEDRKKNIILLDVNSILKDCNISLNLNVIFNPILLRRTGLNRRDYYVACTGAEISIFTNFGKVYKYTDSVS